MIDFLDSWEFRLLRLPLVGELVTRFASAASMRHLIRKSFHDRGRMPSVRWIDTEQGVSHVTGPVMILWGTHDRIFAVERLALFTDHLPDISAHVLAGAGHSVQDDRPDLAYPC